MIIDNLKRNKPLLGLIAVIILALLVLYVLFGSSNNGGKVNTPVSSGVKANNTEAAVEALSNLSGNERHVSKNPMSIRVLSAGVNHTCAIDFGRKVYCWGGANKGSLGDDGKMRKCEVEDGESGLRCEYRNPNLETTHYSFTPVSVFKGEAPSEGEYLSDAQLLAVGDLFACAAIGEEKAVYCWGRGSSGQLGNGKRADQDRPVAVCGEGYTTDCKNHVLKGVTALSAGAEHVCAIVGDKATAYCWGNGSNGRLGNGKTEYQLTPVAICKNSKTEDCDADPMTDVKTIVAGTYLSCAAVGDNRQGFCWGDGSSHQLGNNNQDNNQNKPSPVCASGASDCTVSPFLQVHKFSIGQSHTCAIAGDDRVAYCWGQARYGQLGNNNNIDNQKTPSAVCIPGTTDSEEDWKCSEDPKKILTKVQDISTGFVHTCATVNSERRAYCWGEYFFGRLGDNGTHNVAVPVPVYNGYDKDGYTIDDEENVWLKSVESLTLGSNYSCSVLQDSTAKCWGNNQLGQLGDKERINMLIPSVVGF